ncbi:MAG TPA: peptidylprolyl isomerase [Arachidicoccus sp.]|nr:peptidylprolyl isomerase [Arachidicoccus sp.]
MKLNRPLLSLPISLVFCLLLLLGCGQKYSEPHVLIETKFGDIELALYPDRAPKTVAAFLSYVDQGLYNDASFYRVLNKDNQATDASKSELIQGGIWQTNPDKLRTLKGIPHESTQRTGIKHLNGTISLAREAPGTANSEFFIVIGDQKGYDSGGVNNPDHLGYAAFGRVVRGMDIVQLLYNKPERDQSFDPPIPIFTIKRL